MLKKGDIECGLKLKTPGSMGLRIGIQIDRQNDTGRHNAWEFPPPPSPEFWITFLRRNLFTRVFLETNYVNLDF